VQISVEIYVFAAIQVLPGPYTPTETHGAQSLSASQPFSLIYSNIWLHLASVCSYLNEFFSLCRVTSRILLAE
jgi:hypothetical protein